MAFFLVTASGSSSWDFPHEVFPGGSGKFRSRTSKFLALHSTPKPMQWPSPKMIVRDGRKANSMLRECTELTVA